jgi:hypothetical protein
MRLLALCLVCFNALALQPGKLPNGQLRRFRVNEDLPCSDLKAVEADEAIMIMKHWKNNIMVQPSLNKEDKHILERIYTLEKFINENDDPRFIYLIWVPEGIIYEVLFLVMVLVTKECFIVSFLVQSPYWDSSQIESTELKRTLEHLSSQTQKNIYFTELYKNDVRFKLAWKDWQ